MLTEMHREASSFRDPAGFLLWRNGELLRCVTDVGKSDMDTLFASGLYAELAGQGLLVPHEDLAIPLDIDEEVVRCMKPQLLPFISYPYEWSASQLRDAALLTLRVLEISLEYGMILKDASAFNVAFKGCKPIFLDILSFTKRNGDAAWPGYRQFCEHFLLPLLLSRTLGEAAPALLMHWMHGIPLQTGKRMLSWIDRIRPSVAMHIGIHATMASNVGSSRKQTREKRNTGHLKSLVQNLENIVSTTSRYSVSTKWGKYREVQPYTAKDSDRKDAVVRQVINHVEPKMVWDIGCNDGKYSRIAAENGADVIAMDGDAELIGRLYSSEKDKAGSKVTPIVLDISKPSPAMGWDNSERRSFVERGKPDLILYLAIIHHIRYEQGIPLKMQLRFLARLAMYVLIEWVPVDDVNVAAYKKRPELASLGYGEEEFQSGIRQHFTILAEFGLSGSGRKFFLLRRTHVG